MVISVFCTYGDCCYFIGALEHYSKLTTEQFELAHTFTYITSEKKNQLKKRMKWDGISRKLPDS